MPNKAATLLPTANSQQPTANSHNCAQRKKILYVTHYSSLGGGANLALLHMMLDMRERYNISPSVLAPEEGELSERCREENIPAFTKKFPQWQTSAKGLRKLSFTLKNYAKQFIYFPKILSFLKGQCFDLIHTNTSITDAGFRISHHLGIPHIWHIREYGLEDYEHRYIVPDNRVRYEYGGSAKVITISKALYDNYVAQKRLCFAYNTVCVPDGLKVNEEYHKRYIADGRRVNFVLSGIIYPGKNQMTALKACLKLRNRTDNFMLHFLGRHNNKYGDSLKEFVHSNGLEDNVKFWGWREDIHSVLRDMDVGLMLSNCEAFGRVTVEYMLDYMPVIGVNSGATPEIILDGETGYICNLNDADMLAELMYRFIMNPGLLSEMGNKGRERAVKNFSLERNTDDVYRIYQEACIMK